ncbi:sigma-70 family RNA polymerase sigma factor [Pararhizobium sp. BT-229]|uniref:sigma-70 family RNA polymerase sigma factor n=1 Tax=Pararhizobium sp. BT-229 TaxID=2986923 RepID=UPI0021F6B37D|nr:sigma-70 family RNA polymerase sigma factor [Pararhizobium sp. BT-229]MCV9963324.1 sigma-70 family RNA polymerase sigma factor [Pararhizobium sp. BT-229]
MTDQEVMATFDPLRPRLCRIAYRMLGSIVEAEDVVQEAFLRWLDTDRDAVREPAAFLRRVVTRLCLDQLKSARRRRETYIGPWLPEPMVEESDEIDDITLPLMMALERLSPLERAAFLLHDVFGVSFDEIAKTIGRKPATCRRLASRARVNVRNARRRFDIPPEQGLEIASAFFAASRSGNVQQLRSLLATDTVVLTDGGGKTGAPRRPIAGVDNVVRLFASLGLIFAKSMSKLVGYEVINGLPGFITIEEGARLQTTALEIRDGRITMVYVTRNPEKLRHLYALH